MERSPWWTVGVGTVTISASSALVTGIYSIFRNTPQSLVGTSALNSGITAATFFSFREFVVSPALNRIAPWQQYAYRRRELGIESSEEGSMSSGHSVPNLRTNKLLDSGVSGGITGGLLRGLLSGRRAAVSGMLIAGAFCTLMQFGYNELSVARLRFISRLQEENRSAVDIVTPIPQRAAKELSGSFLQVAMKMVGMAPISDDEYLKKLKRKREMYLKRIAALEQQVEEEKTTEELDKS